LVRCVIFDPIVWPITIFCHIMLIFRRPLNRMTFFSQWNQIFPPDLFSVAWLYFEYMMSHPRQKYLVKRRFAELWTSGPKNCEPDFIILRISIDPWSFSRCFFSNSFKLSFFMPWTPSAIENFLSFFYWKSLQFDRTQCTDSKYHTFSKMRRIIRSIWSTIWEAWNPVFGLKV